MSISRQLSFNAQPFTPSNRPFCRQCSALPWECRLVAQLLAVRPNWHGAPHATGDHHGWALQHPGRSSTVFACAWPVHQATISISSGPTEVFRPPRPWGQRPDRSTQRMLTLCGRIASCEQIETQRFRNGTKTWCSWRHLPITLVGFANLAYMGA